MTVTFAQFKAQIESYEGSPHINPRAEDNNPNAPCLYWSEGGSVTGAKRCMIGQALADLGVADQIDDVSAASTMLGPYRSAFASTLDFFDVATLADQAQGLADGTPTGGREPLSWGEVVAELRKGGIL